MKPLIEGATSTNFTAVVIASAVDMVYGQYFKSIFTTARTSFTVYIKDLITNLITIPFLVDILAGLNTRNKLEPVAIIAQNLKPIWKIILAKPDAKIAVFNRTTMLSTIIIDMIDGKECYVCFTTVHTLVAINRKDLLTVLATTCNLKRMTASTLHTLYSVLCITNMTKVWILLQHLLLVFNAISKATFAYTISRFYFMRCTTATNRVVFRYYLTPTFVLILSGARYAPRLQSNTTFAKAGSGEPQLTIRAILHFVILSPLVALITKGVVCSKTSMTSDTFISTIRNMFITLTRLAGITKTIPITLVTIPVISSSGEPVITFSTVLGFQRRFRINLKNNIFNWLSAQSLKIEQALRQVMGYTLHTERVTFLFVTPPVVTATRRQRHVFISPVYHANTSMSRNSPISTIDCEVA